LKSEQVMDEGEVHKTSEMVTSIDLQQTTSATRNNEVYFVLV